MAGMMKEFRFDTYNGKSVVICGPLYRSMPVFMEFLTHPEIELYFCYGSNTKYSWEILLRAFFDSIVRTIFPFLKIIALSPAPAIPKSACFASPGPFTTHPITATVIFLSSDKSSFCQRSTKP